MKITLIILKDLMICSLLLQIHCISDLSAQIITVRQDGSGDFLSIQQAVDSASNGDTVLVWPGQYFENVFIDQKAIVLGSLTLTTNDPGYANITIIDGNSSGSCIYAYYCQDSIEIIGFTLQHGSGSTLGDSNERWGGGIFFYYSKGSVQHCLIKNNLVPGIGGGILVLHSDIALSGNLIKENHAFRSGGGIAISGRVLFDSTNLNNIYLNYSAAGCDIHLASEQSPEPIQVCVDTFTVQNPDRYYLLSTSGQSVPNEDFSYSIHHAKIETSNSDLFVCPEGDDANTGLTQDEPLKTIAFALSKTVSDSLHPNTIHLANGIYSFNNGEKYPLNLRSHISLIGENRDSTVLDASNIIFHIKGNIYTNNYAIENITFRNGNGDSNATTGYGSIIIIKNDHVVFENLLFAENAGEYSAVGAINFCNQFVVKNSEFSNNYGGGTVRTFTTYLTEETEKFADTVTFENCIFRGNIPSPDTALTFSASISASGDMWHQDSMTCFIINCLFTDALLQPILSPVGFTSMGALDFGQIFAVNCTFSDNIFNSQEDQGGAVGVIWGSKLHIYNSILYNDFPNEIYMYTYPGENNYLNIYNSLVERGFQGIQLYSEDNYITYDPSNLDVYPEWDTTEPYKFSLLEGSPCIDAGTLDLPPGITLPEYDLAGNPRVWGESVDMGAYEYGPWVRVKEVGSRQSAVGSQMGVNPNPFSYGTYIEYELKKSGRLDISVYSLSGMKVRTLAANQGAIGDKGKFYWDGTDADGNDLPAGVYLIRMTMDGKEGETVKLVKSE
jgi:pectin methylesterase-like acyl-CoA thioesterase